MKIIPMQVRDRLLEKKRKDALAGNDAVKYYELCEELGVEPEALDLYERGRIESERSQLESGLFLDNSSVNLRNNKGMEKKLGYSPFYMEGRHLNTRNFGADAERKRVLLTKYFQRFRPNGRQSIGKMDDLQVGYLFNQMIHYAEKRIEK